MGFFGTHDTKVSNEQLKITKNMLEKGQDPKEMLHEVCRPSCKWWEDKLKRCEAKLQQMEDVDPEMSCVYPHRDWVTCIDGCANPIIQNMLVGQEKGFIS